MELPIECWELIVSHLHDRRHLEPLSLVSKQFLSLTNRLRYSISIPAHAPAGPLLARFCNLRSIDLSSFLGPADCVLLQISRSCPSLESLNLSNRDDVPLGGLREIGSNNRGIKILVLSEVGGLEDRNLTEISKLFPFLEELDISYPQGTLSERVTDEGVSALSSNLKRLRKIDISGNFFVSDQSLASLSANCESLVEVGARDCSFITENGIACLIQNRPNLGSLNVDTEFSAMYCGRMSQSFKNARGLRSLDFSLSCVSDILLSSLAEADIPLRTIALSHSSGFTFDGIFALLSKHRSVEVLDLEGVNCLTDHSIIELCSFLSHLSSINLSLCSKLGSSTFYNLIKSCPMLKKIKMENINLKKEDCSMVAGSAMNSQVRTLSLGKNGNLSNDCIKKFVQACPNLDFLDVSHCPRITEQAIKAVLRQCSEKIMHLDISHCKEIKSLRLDFDIPRLEVLRAQGLGFNCQDLGVIGKRCCRLLHLDLEGCLNVTDEGVKEVLRHCRVLREVNLRWCDKVSVDVIAWMVFSRSSLRKITPPRGFSPTANQRSFFLRHGCLVTSG